MPSDELIINPESKHISDLSFVGSKVIGLSSFKPDWVPKFFVISTSLFNKLQAMRSEKDTSFITCEQLLSESEKKSLNRALKSLCLKNNDQVIIRSSAVTEGLALRGYFKTEKSEPTIKAILAACDRIFQHTLSFGDKQRQSPIALALIVQVYLDSMVIGHLSNERRVATRVQEWLFEVEKGQLKTIRKRYAIKRDTKRAYHGELIANDENELINQLRSVAASVNDMGIRLHIEWVWHEKRLWIVQGDRDLETRGSNPRSHLRYVKYVENIGSLKSFTTVDSILHKRWSKVQCQKYFKNAGLPTVPIWVLEDKFILKELQKDRITSQLEKDIKKLLSYGPIVIRMDNTSDNPDSSSELLTRSDCVLNYDQAKDFLIRCAKNMTPIKGALSDFCFIIHHYIPARSSAFCLAYPDMAKVRIDSTWGLPDSLLFYPHDSFEVTLDNPIDIKKHKRFKDDYLAPSLEGDWEPTKAGKPWDWSFSLEDQEIIQISRDSKKLADSIGKCIQLMWLVDIPKERGLEPMIPWWFGTKTPPIVIESADPRVFYRDRITISNMNDLERLKSEKLGNTKGSLLIRLIPEPHLLRNKAFLEEVARVAVCYDIPVELHGSPLHHAYYQLKQFGVKIQCTDAFELNAKPQYFDKLVRDQIPIIIKGHGERESSIMLKGDDLIRVLKSKVVEEALELYSATNSDDIIEEIVDVFEVLFTLAQHGGISIGEIERRANLKRKKRGGFSKGLVLIQTREVPLIEVIKPQDQLIDRKAVSAIFTTKRIPKYQDGKISIPIVPPGVREANVEVKEMSCLYKIRYQNKEIEISWAPIRPKVPSNQLHLLNFPQ